MAKTTKATADRPKSDNGKQYHLETGPGDLAERCLLVGAPERAEMIAKDVLVRARKVGDHRGLKSFTGEFSGMPMSVVTTGMGSATTGIVLPEAVRSGGRVFIRVGTCGSLKPDVEIGAACICQAAVRLDGASENWAPIQYPAFADWRVVAALVASAEEFGADYHVGVGVTTTCFNEGQARPDDSGYVPPRIQAMHDELVRRGALFYSMEEATLFVWCATHGGLPCGAIDAAIANRVTGEFQLFGEMDAAYIAASALIKIDT